LPRDWFALRRRVLECDPICVLCRQARSEEDAIVGVADLVAERERDGERPRPSAKRHPLPRQSNPLGGPVRQRSLDCLDKEAFLNS
jgi:hypothetical protein